MFGVAVILMVMDWLPWPPWSSPPDRPGRPLLAALVGRRLPPGPGDPQRGHRPAPGPWPGCGRSSRSAASGPPPPAWPRPTTPSGSPTGAPSGWPRSSSRASSSWHGRHRGRPRRRRPAGARRRPRHRRPGRVPPLPPQPVRPGAAALRAVRQLPVGHRRAERVGTVLAEQPSVREASDPSPSGPARRRPARGRLLRLRPGIRRFCTTSTCAWRPGRPWP